MICRQSLALSKVTNFTSYLGIVVILQVDIFQFLWIEF